MSSSQANSLEKGSHLGRFELLMPIARGGMAEVWAARPPGARGFRKQVALKTLHHGASDMRMEEMLLEEAKVASLIVHPNVVSTHEFGEDRGLLYLVMEWVDGLPLSEVMKAQPGRTMPTSVCVNIMAQVCRGLHAAHELTDERDQKLGLVHRDISPQNILVDRTGLAKIVDFGVAKATARDAGLTEEGELKGKIAYMSPEQVSGDKVDRRTDLFALGAVFYLLTTGKHPFRGATVAETVQTICSRKPPTDPKLLGSDYPADLARILLRALRGDPEERYKDARELLADLESSFPKWAAEGLRPEVARHLEEVVGRRLQERRTSLQAAHDELDASEVRSGTMRALTLDSVHETPSTEGDTGSGPSQVIVVSNGGAGFPIKVVSWGVAALCALVATQIVFLGRGGNPSDVAPAASPVVQEQNLAGVESGEDRVEPPQIETREKLDVADVAAGDGAAAEEAKKEASEPSPKPPQKPTRVARPIAKPVAPKAAAPSSSPRSESDLNSRASEKKDVDAWDLNAFGERH